MEVLELLPANANISFMLSIKGFVCENMPIQVNLGVF